MAEETKMLDRKWQTIEKKPVENLTELLRELTADGQKIVHIGTDSQQAGPKTALVTVIVVLTPGKGGRAFFTKEIVPRIASLRERLLREVWMSVNLGLELHGEIIPEQNQMIVHVDANPDTQYRSSDYVQELAGMVAAQGFSVLLKPESWAATHVADHTIKHKVLG